MKWLRTLTLSCLVAMPVATGCVHRTLVHTESETTQRTISTEPVLAPTPPAPSPLPEGTVIREEVEEKSTEKRVIERKIVP